MRVEYTSDYLPDVLLHNANKEAELLEEKVPEGVVVGADDGHHAGDDLDTEPDKYAK